AGVGVSSVTISLDTQNLHRQIERIRAGDAAAQEELIRAVSGRLERIARHMLSRFPGVRSQVETDDILQNTLLRLLAALRSVRPASTRYFFPPAAYLTRQELIALARRFWVRPAAEPAAATPRDLISGDESEPHHLDAWRRFHEAVEALPADVREVVSLTFYHR